MSRDHDKPLSIWSKASSGGSLDSIGDLHKGEALQSGLPKHTDAGSEYIVANFTRQRQNNLPTRVGISVASGTFEMPSRFDNSNTIVDVD